MSDGVHQALIRSDEVATFRLGEVERIMDRPPELERQGNGPLAERATRAPASRPWTRALGTSHFAATLASTTSLFTAADLPLPIFRCRSSAADLPLPIFADEVDAVGFLPPRASLALEGARPLDPPRG